MMGCNRKEEIEIYDKKMPIYNINKELSILELDEIYQIYEYGFGGTKLFEYLKKKIFVIIV